ncbi:MAG: glycerol-3-phosphate acyltransferase [Candidatus Margulisbacteria bacterium]|nr:glycerol-3-phosphate acyltransferase [Candidatus Margulisiibacteriota bacterium]
MIEFLYLLGAAGVGLMPFCKLLPWLWSQGRQVSSKLDHASDTLYCSPRMLVFVLSHALDFLKGFGVLYFGFYFFGESYWVLAGLIAMLMLHVWSPFLERPGKYNLTFLIWGVYSVLFPILFLVGPILFGVLALGLNSFLLATMSHVVLMFFVLWYFELPLLSLPINFFIFLLTLMTLSEYLFRHFESTPYNLLRSYRLRNRGL